LTSVDPAQPVADLLPEPRTASTRVKGKSSSSTSGESFGSSSSTVRSSVRVVAAVAADSASTARIENTAPCGSPSTAVRPTWGMSKGSTATAPPSSTARSTVTSQFSTPK